MLLLRGATYIQKHTQEAVLVSIHAPLARSNFKGFILSLCLQFQYMLLLRGATFGQLNYNNAMQFQYMLLLRGATS